MKKLVGILIVTLLVITLVLTACGQKPAPAPTTSAPAPAITTTAAPKPAATTSAAPATTTTTAAPKPSATATAPAQAPAAIKWVGQSHAGGVTLQHKSLQRVAERIKTLSGGRLDMRVEIGGALQPATKEFDGVTGGVLDFAITCYMYWADKFPAAGLFTMKSGGMSPMEALAWFREGGGFELTEEMTKSYDIHMERGAGWMGTPEVFLHTNKALASVADLKALKIRAAGDGGAILSRVGAGVVMMAAGEIFEAMQRGTIDAFEAGSPSLNWDLKLNEASKYLYLSGARQPYEYNVFIVNTKKWAALPDDVKGIVSEVNQAEAIRAYDEDVRLDLVALEKFRSYGTKVETLPKVIEDAYSAEADKYYVEMAAKDAFFKKVLDSYTAFQTKFRGTWARP